MCELNITTSTDFYTLNVLPTENDVWKAIGEKLLSVEIPSTVFVDAPNYGDAVLHVNKRGKYIENGVEKPSMYVTVDNNINGLRPSLYEAKYLTCIHPESNNYKWYKLEPSNYSGRTVDVGASYGRIGAEKGEMFGVKTLQEPYAPFLFWIRYYEKLSKGYIDQSDIYLKEDISEPKTVQETPKKAVNEASQELYSLVKRFAKEVVESNLISTRITQAQVIEAKKIWSRLGQYKQVAAFNRQLQKLLTLSPRKARYINILLAQSSSDFPRIIEREETLINAMEAMVSPVTSMKSSIEGFEDYDVEVYKATTEQRESVLSKLSDTLKPKVSEIYRVIPKRQKERFDAYLKSNNIRTVKQLWHGSKNENWKSIITSKLLLNPNAKITGKMLGNGIYFSGYGKGSSLKSWNYTSYNGTYWANGRSDVGIMGLYATAYGNPLNVTSDIRSYTKRELADKHANCVHAYGGAGMYLRNDEIVFFDEDATLLQYIVVFK